MRSKFNRHSDFVKRFNRINRVFEVVTGFSLQVFWVFFAVVVTLIVGQFALTG